MLNLFEQASQPMKAFNLQITNPCHIILVKEVPRVGNNIVAIALIFQMGNILESENNAVFEAVEQMLPKSFLLTTPKFVEPLYLSREATGFFLHFCKMFKCPN